MNLSCPSFPFTFITTIFFFFASTTHIINTLISTDIIHQTCKTCAAQSTVNYDFCLSSLHPCHTSQPANLSSLAVASMLEANATAATTVSTIQQLIASGGVDSSTLSCLCDCLELYEDGLVDMEDAIGAFSSGDYATANVKVSAVMEDANTCEDGFEELGEYSPLHKENWSLQQFGAIVLCIMNMLSSGSYAVSS